MSKMWFPLSMLFVLGGFVGMSIATYGMWLENIETVGNGIFIEVIAVFGVMECYDQSVKAWRRSRKCQRPK